MNNSIKILFLKIYDGDVTMNGAQWVVHALRAQGVKTVFGYPGGAIMPVYDALYDGGVEHFVVPTRAGCGNGGNRLCPFYRQKPVFVSPLPALAPLT